jgi:hypothetical protein
MEGRTEKQMNPSWKESKKHLDREEKRLRKISDRNPNIERDLKGRNAKTKALSKHR